ncbi:arabinosyltransferase domain-containing protein [Kibdelosporangium phytohabitans]|uniref:Arabinosyltransferase n=1 Tax=Kibdelosporangium phytohabitans TaxID=860235 RepID=A0A0N7F538_9PSEU|nr:arabinosyltransferase domain-containing protein [Kibdelosporangium phytohabitans]ALG13151.1 hypothetical protein AOZ06_45455 [Kibdelosporangium phytohabitans]MBE1464902.1 arabinosyltransferase C [Kibdelosporangium phytohabitans]
MASDPTVLRQDAPRLRSSRGWIVLLCVSLLGILVAAAVPFSPVRTNETVVTWPEHGQAPVSTTALFSPYRPAEVHVTVPCPVVRAAAGPQRRTVVGTDPAGTGIGVQVAVENNVVTVSVGSAKVLDAPIAAGCDVQVDVTDSGATARIGDAVRGVDGELVAEVHGFITDVPAESARGLEVRVRARIYSETAPSTVKLVAVGAWVVLAVLVLWGLGRSRRAPRQRETGEGPRWPRRIVDAGLLVALLGWAVLGPATWDDSYSAMTIRNSEFSGNIDNYYSQQNTSEMFTLSQWLLWPVLRMSLDFPVVRLPFVLLATGTWLMLTRSVLPSVLPRHAKRWPVLVITAVALLAWWMPYGQTLRFEPFAAFGTTAVLALVLRGTNETKPSTVRLGLAALVTGLTAAVTPTGALLAAVVWVVLASRVWRVLADGRGWRTAHYGRVVARLTSLGALASSVVVITFLTQSWHGFSKAAEQHNSGSMPNYGWFQDTVRYNYLLSLNDYSGTVARRVPVLLALVLLPVAGLLLARGVRALPGLKELPLAAALMVGGLLALALTPSKWSHHFGALAGFGSLFIAVAVVATAQAARRWGDDRRARAAGLTGLVFTVVAAAMSFSGMNTWVLWSQYGVPWQTGPVRPLNNPITWLVLVAVVSAVVWIFRARTRISAGGVLVAAPGVVVTAALTASVGMLLVSFVVAPIRQASVGGYSIGLQNIAHLTGRSCGLADKVEMYPDVPGGVLKPHSGTVQSTGFAAQSAWVSAPPLLPDKEVSKHVWGSVAAGMASTGKLTTQWFALPAAQPGQQVAVSAAGRTGDGNRLALEFGQSGPSGVRPVGERVLDDSALDKALRFSDYGSPTKSVPPVQNNPGWRALWVPRADVPPDADVVRVKAVDDTADEGGWIGTTGPRLLKAVPMRQFLADYEDVWLHPAMSLYLPCVRNFAPAAHGMAVSPDLVINAGFPGGRGPAYPLAAGYDHPFAGLPRTALVYEVPSRLTGGRREPSQLDWGHVMVVKHTAGRDRYSVTTRRVDRQGWEGDD